MKTPKTMNSQCNLKKEKWSWKNQAPWLQIKLQSHSYQRSMYGTGIKQKYRSMEHDRINLCTYLLLLLSCSVTKLCSPLCYAMDCSMPGFPVLHYFPEFVQTHVHWFSDAIQPNCFLSPAFNLSQHQGLFQWVSSSYQVAKVLELQIQQWS